ncbi:HNH endonuclease signature motif containing protein (plasmid) [Azospirillum sp. A26]|uniref:HNH endonuclease signature motif containing protein n=1 Tax=Azospirillum sp. A26 TaxID=3160607 RepID=UPI00366C2463
MSKHATATPELTQARLRELLHYDPETGVFTWLVRRQGIRADRAAGCVSSPGYILIGVDGRLCRAHRLAWLYMTGEWPAAEIDHINRARGDNRWNNLRLATGSQNQGNRSVNSDNKSGVKGVSWSQKRGMWKAQIGAAGKRRCLGYFPDCAVAAAAYAAAAAEHFGEFANAPIP